MKKLAITTAAALGALAAFCAWGGWVYEGQWGSRGSGNGQFDDPGGVEVAPNGNVYVGDQYNHRIQYFTPTGSFLGKWGSFGSGNGQFDGPAGVAVAFTGNVYVTEDGAYYENYRVQYFTSSGSYLGKWGSKGTGNGQFNGPLGVAVAPNGNVCVADRQNHRIQYFTPTGSFLEKWGSYGTGNGQFYLPCAVAFNAAGDPVYISDGGNDRVQYFKWVTVAVVPTSLGRVKALFE